MQSVDLHSDAAAELMQQFRFIPDARLDDVMISIASHGGGVGPHFDSYDVFLLQAAGQREWRYGHQKDLSLEPGLPLKILSRFEPEASAVLSPGDMLYLPPQAAHDGIAVGDGCMTISIGFRAPTQATLARGLLEAAADQVMARVGLLGGPYGEPALPGPKLSAVYRDPAQPAVATPAELPDGLIAATLETVDKLRFDEALASRFLGCWLTEPSNLSVFDAPGTWMWTWKKTGPHPAACCWTAAAACSIAASSSSSTARPRWFRPTPRCANWPTPAAWTAPIRSAPGCRTRPGPAWPTGWIPAGSAT